MTVSQSVIKNVTAVPLYSDTGFNLGVRTFAGHYMMINKKEFISEELFLCLIEVTGIFCLFPQNFCSKAKKMCPLLTWTLLVEMYKTINEHCRFKLFQ